MRPLEEQQKLDAERDQRRESSKMRDRESRKEALIESKELELEKSWNILEAKKQAELIKGEVLLAIEQQRHELRPEELDQLYFDAVRHSKLNHGYRQLDKQADHEREKEMVAHKAKWEILVRKATLQLEQKYGEKGLSDEEIASLWIKAQE